MENSTYSELSGSEYQKGQAKQIADRRQRKTVWLYVLMTIAIVGIVFLRKEPWLQLHIPEGELVGGQPLSKEILTLVNGSGEVTDHTGAQLVNRDGVGVTNQDLAAQSQHVVMLTIMSAVVTSSALWGRNILRGWRLAGPAIGFMMFWKMCLSALHGSISEQLGETPQYLTILQAPWRTEFLIQTLMLLCVVVFVATWMVWRADVILEKAGRNNPSGIHLLATKAVSLVVNQVMDEREKRERN